MAGECPYIIFPKCCFVFCDDRRSFDYGLMWGYLVLYGVDVFLFIYCLIRQLPFGTKILKKLALSRIDDEAVVLLLKILGLLLAFVINKTKLTL